MFGYNKESFECLIRNIENDVAFVDMIDEEDETSYIEIPKEDFDKFKIEFKAGNMFYLILKYFMGWEKCTMTPIKRKLISKEESGKLTKYYEKKYRSV